jgi:hypothetical protein
MVLTQTERRRIFENSVEAYRGADKLVDLSKKCYRPRTNLSTDENGDILVYSCQISNVREIKGIGRAR